MPDKEEIESTKAPLIEHLTELRKRLIHCVLAFLVCMVISFAFWEPIFTFLTDPICNALLTRGQECNLILIKLQEGFFVAVRISFMGGFILSFPFLGFQLWRFVAPGLYKNEKSAFLPFMIASPFMFLLGASFAFFIVIPLAFNFFLSFQQESTLTAPAPTEIVISEDLETEADQQLSTENGTEVDILADGREIIADVGVTFQGSVAEYLSLTIKFILAFGVCFQLPVLLTLMGKAGLVTGKGLAGFRKYAVVCILVLAAVVTPPDVITQVILFTAVYGLYEISIWLVKRVEKKREEQYAEEGILFDEDEEEEST
ncbi:MAG: twin-arginine translocase subunit TatC [Rhodobacteraceae bacterium]|nr:twin-arginine translocase subunit TatC [Paracoccaceae bacterium]